MSASSQQDYYELTARQLADFLIPRLTAESTDGSKKKKMLSQNSDRDDTGRYGSGIMTLTDAYCLFNRARGTNLISPKDLLREACTLLGDLKVGLSQRIFPTGVIVIQLDALALDGLNGATIRQTLLGLCPTTASHGGISRNLSPLLAMEQLEEAERLGWHCCDDTTLETVRFYPN
jgi:ESCRT-II complex subunit VPS36